MDRIGVGEQILGVDEEVPLNLFNVLVISVAMFSSLALAFFGVQQGDLALMAVGSIFGLALVTGVVLSRFEMLTGEGTIGRTATVYLLAHLPFWVPTVATDVQFSAFSTPTGSYLSLLADTEVYTQAIINQFLAPSIENVAFIGMMGLLYLALEHEFEWGQLISLAVTLTVGGAAFALMHGVRDPVFFVLAAGSMILWGFLVFAHDLELADSELLAGALAAGWGLHRGNNMAAEGMGFIDLWTTLLAAPAPISRVSWAIVLLDLLIILAAAVYVIRFAVSR